MEAALERSTDFVARYGGEEFVCVLSDTSLEGAVKLAEKIRKNIEALLIPNKQTGTLLKITASLGVATAIPSQDFPPRILIEAADKRLYEAKRSGRNRVISGVESYE